MAVSTVTGRELYLNAAETLGKFWPSFLPELPDASILEHVWIQPLRVRKGDGVILGATKLFLETDLTLSLPGLDAIALTIAAQHGGTVVPIEVQIRPELKIRIATVPVTLRLLRTPDRTRQCPWVLWLNLTAAVRLIQMVIP